jgi:hypothetical protein
LDLRGSTPTFIHISDGKTHEVNTLDQLHIEPGACYLLDRGYLDFQRQFVIHRANAFFVTRAKSNTKIKRRYSNPVDRASSNIVCDQTSLLTIFYSSQDHPATCGHQGREGQTNNFFDQELRPQTRFDREPVPPALAGRIVFQMYQAALAHQDVLWHQRERGQDANLDRSLRIRADRHYQETLEFAL